MISEWLFQIGIGVALLLIVLFIWLWHEFKISITIQRRIRDRSEFLDNLDLVGMMIHDIVNRAPYYHLNIEGNTLQRWLKVKDFTLAPGFSHEKCDVVFQYDQDDNVMILVPEHIKTIETQNRSICPCFLLCSPETPGWKKVCKNIAHLSYGMNYVGIPIVLRFIQNPEWCGVQNCDFRSCYIKIMLQMKDDEIFDYERVSDID